MADFLDDVKSLETPAAVDRRAAAAAEMARLAGKIALDYFERAEVSWVPSTIRWPGISSRRVEARERASTAAVFA